MGVGCYGVRMIVNSEYPRNAYTVGGLIGGISRISSPISNYFALTIL